MTKTVEEVLDELGTVESFAPTPGAKAKTMNDHAVLGAAVNRVPHHLEPLAVGRAIWAATGGSEGGRQLFERWVKRLPKYEGDPVGVMWWQIGRSPPDSDTPSIWTLAQKERNASDAGEALHGPLGPEPAPADPDGYDPSASGHHHERHGHGAGDEGIKMPPDPMQFTGAFWLSRDLPPPDFLLGHLLSTTSRVMLIGPTGIGKSNVALAIAFAAAAGAAFLHWAGRRPARVVYIDGEMSVRHSKERIEQARKRFGRMPETLWIINREDYPSLPPLNTPEGQRFVEWLVESIGGVDLVIFDNIQALTVGSLKEDESWRGVIDWARTLTAKKIGQVWMHHTGHATDRGYGDKSREWQMDTVGIMSEPAAPVSGVLVQLTLKFTKARERSSASMDDFADTMIMIDASDQWQSDSRKLVKPQKVPPLIEKFYDNLIDLFAGGAGKRDLPFRGAPPAVTLNAWRDYLVHKGLLDREKPNSVRSLFSKAKSELITADWIRIEGDYVWSIRPQNEAHKGGEK
jgi:hypothetical protein